MVDRDFDHFRVRQGAIRGNESDIIHSGLRVVRVEIERPRTIIVVRERGVERHILRRQD